MKEAGMMERERREDLESSARQSPNRRLRRDSPLR